MAALTEADTIAISGAINRDELTQWGALTKADILAAVVAIDAFFDANATAINNALPQPARAQMTLAQKSRLVRYVIQRRYG